MCLNLPLSAQICTNVYVNFMSTKIFVVLMLDSLTRCLLRQMLITLVCFVLLWLFI